VLLEFLLRVGDGLEFAVKNNGARRSGALIDGKYV
jgi:hypothetical protein